MARNFIGLQFGDPILAAALGGAEFVERGVKAVADHAAFLDRQRRFVHDGAGNQFDQVGRFGDLRIQFRNQGLARLPPSARRLENFFDQMATRRRLGSHRLQNLFQRGNLFERQPQRDQVARVAAAGTQAAQGAFQIADVRQLLAKTVKAEGVFDEGLHRVLPPANRLRRWRAVAKAIGAAAARPSA